MRPLVKGEAFVSGLRFQNMNWKESREGRAERGMCCPVGFRYLDIDDDICSSPFALKHPPLHHAGEMVWVDFRMNYK